MAIFFCFCSSKLLQIPLFVPMPCEKDTSKTCHILTTLMVLSPLPDAIRRPLGLNDTDVTERECPSNVATHAPLPESQTRTVLSSLPDASRVPSGLKAIDLTAPECPSSVATHALLPQSHARTVWS